MAMETKDIIKYAAIAAAAYIAWVYVLEPMLNPVEETAAAPPTDTKTPQQLEAEKKLAEAKTAQEALEAQEAIKAANAAKLIADAQKATFEANAAKQAAQSLEQKMNQAAGGAGKEFNVHEWNYFLRQINPNAVVTDLVEVGFDPSWKMPLQQYFAGRMRAQLMDNSVAYNDPTGGVKGIPAAFIN